MTVLYAYSVTQMLPDEREFLWDRQKHYPGIICEYDDKVIFNSLDVAQHYLDEVNYFFEDEWYMSEYQDVWDRSPERVEVDVNILKIHN